MSDTSILATRMSRLGTESAFEVLAKARALEAQGRTIIHLEIGEPDFDTPEHIVDAAIDALKPGTRTTCRRGNARDTARRSRGTSARTGRPAYDAGDR